MDLSTAVDLFAGAGGATQGLRDAGFDVVAAVENDPSAARSWQLNHPGKMLVGDIRGITGRDIMDAGGFDFGELDLLKACPPCQGFSSLRGSRIADEDRNDLVLDTLRLVRELMPKSVLMENVPGLKRDFRFAELKAGLLDLGYVLQDYLVEASALGVPQRRKRLVLIALRGAKSIPATFDDLIPESERRPAMTAGVALDRLRAAAVENDPNHRWRQAKGIVVERIQAIPIDGNRFDLPEHLQLACHRRLVTSTGRVKRSAAGSYGRIHAREPAPTMTTRCTTPACGSFIHPTENRGISLREAAAFQTFPPGYNWFGTYESIERQIGNAVPVWMAQALGSAMLGRLKVLAES